jgi:hypothetical protein
MQIFVKTLTGTYRSYFVDHEDRYVDDDDGDDDDDGV